MIAMQMGIHDSINVRGCQVYPGKLAHDISFASLDRND